MIARLNGQKFDEAEWERQHKLSRETRIDQLIEQKLNEAFGKTTRAYRQDEDTSGVARSRMLAYRQEQFARGLKQCCKG